MAMKISDGRFPDRLDENLQNEFMRGAVSSAQHRFQTRRATAVEELGNWEEWRSHGEEIRQHVLANLDFYLHELSENVERQGGHVFFARTAQEANDYIVSVARKKQAKRIVKAKSMVTEEI